MVRDQPFTAIIRPLDKATKNVYGEARRVWVGDIRTSTIFTNHLETYIPPWYPFLENQTSANMVQMVNIEFPEMDFLLAKETLQTDQVRENEIQDSIDNEFVIVKPENTIEDADLVAFDDHEIGVDRKENVTLEFGSEEFSDMTC